MCLDTLSGDKFKAEREKGHFVGYKVFVKNSSRKLASIFISEKVVQIEKWLSEEKYRGGLLNCYIRNMDNRTIYRKGWHIFLDKNDARDYLLFMNSLKTIVSTNKVLRKVYFRKVITQGYQEINYKNMKTVVAKEMFVPRIR